MNIQEIYDREQKLIDIDEYLVETYPECWISGPETWYHIGTEKLVKAAK
jgi:hypothetical protein